MAAEVSSDSPFQISITPWGVVRVEWRQDVRITGALAAAAMAVVDALNGHRKRSLLVDITGTATPTPEAREVFGRHCSVTRVALLGRSAVDRVHASFGTPGALWHPVPTRFFTSEAAAFAWLSDGGYES